MAVSAVRLTERDLDGLEAGTPVVIGSKDDYATALVFEGSAPELPAWVVNEQVVTRDHLRRLRAGEQIRGAGAISLIPMLAA